MCKQLYAFSLGVLCSHGPSDHLGADGSPSVSSWTCLRSFRAVSATASEISYLNVIKFQQVQNDTFLLALQMFSFSYFLGQCSHPSSCSGPTPGNRVRLPSPSSVSQSANEACLFHHGNTFSPTTHSLAIEPL